MKFLKGRVALNLVAFRRHIPDSHFKLNKYMTDLSSTKTTNTMHHKKGVNFAQDESVEEEKEDE